MALAEPTLHIEVVYSPVAGELRSTRLMLPPGACVRDAIAATGWFDSPAEWASQQLRIGIWGRLKSDAEVLNDRDRVELYRPLLVDPKESRRLRHRRHREARTARR